MQIKAQGLLNAAKFIEAEYGRDALGAVIRACSEPVRDRYISAIAINWHPVEEFLEFVETADKILGHGKGRLIEEIGAAGARANMKGIVVRVAFYMAQPEFFLRRVAGLWRQFNDEGEMLAHGIGERSGAMEVVGIEKPNAVFCMVLTGWIREVALALGIQNPSPRHTQCRTRGDARCYWDVRWSGLRPDQQGVKEARDSIRRLQSRPPSAPPPAPSSGSLPSSPPSAAWTAAAPRSSQGAVRVASKPPPSKDKKR